MGGEFRVLSPCDRDRDSLAGDGAVRWCPDCRKNVYDFAQMRRRDVERLVPAGECCGIISRDADGSMRTADPPPLRRRVVEWLAGIAKVGARWAWAAGESGAASGVVSDQTGAAIPRARVRVDGREELAGEDGRFVIGGLAPGRHRLAVQMDGFLESKVEVTVRAGETSEIPVTLRVGDVSMGVIISLDVMGVVQDPAGNPIRRARVTLHDATGRQLAAATTGRNGGFRIKGPISHAAVQVQASGFHAWDGPAASTLVILQELNRLPR